jgi:hypothetical protein
MQLPSEAEDPRVRRLSSLMFFFVTAALVILIGLIAAGITWAFHPAPKAPCLLDCPPPRPQVANVLPTSGERTFSGSGFEFDYPSSWSASQVRTIYGNSTVLSASGVVLWVSSSPTLSVDDALVNANRFWNPSFLPNVQTIRSIPGAHIGSEDARGVLLGGTTTPGSGGGSAQTVRLPVVAGRRGGMTVVFVGIVPYLKGNDAWGGASGDIDRVLTEFRWKS